jgi:hypothetical protein
MPIIGTELIRKMIVPQTTPFVLVPSPCFNALKWTRLRNALPDHSTILFNLPRNVKKTAAEQLNDSLTILRLKADASGTVLLDCTKLINEETKQVLFQKFPLLFCIKN